MAPSSTCLVFDEALSVFCFHHMPHISCIYYIFTISLTAIRYYTRKDAENAMRYINGTRLDDRIVRTDWDVGFKEGRQYGRGKTGGQVSRQTLIEVDV